MEPKKTPSSAEFLGLYNVPIRSRSRHCDGDYLNVIRNPPPLTLLEVKQMSRSAYEVIFKYANQRWYTPEEIRQYYDLCISEQLTDRSLNISFDKVDDCTLDLVIHLQKLLATNYKLWRIRIGGSSHESTIIIYPKIIRFGSFPVDLAPPSILFSRIIHLEKEAIDMFGYSVEENQLQKLRDILPSLVASELHDKITIIAGFDNYKGDFTEATLWTMCKSDVIADLEMIAPDYSWVASFYRVKSNGDFGRHVTEPSPFWIREWTFPTHQMPLRLSFKAYDAEYNSFTLDVDAKPIYFFRGKDA